MRRHYEPITSTTLLRLASAVLPEQLALALFGRRVPVRAERIDVVRRSRG